MTDAQRHAPDQLLDATTVVARTGLGELLKFRVDSPDPEVVNVAGMTVHGYAQPLQRLR
jgi:hypothetical protein